jgi:hypothetical protein
MRPFVAVILGPMVFQNYHWMLVYLGRKQTTTEGSSFDSARAVTQARALVRNIAFLCIGVFAPWPHLLVYCAYVMVAISVFDAIRSMFAASPRGVAVCGYTSSLGTCVRVAVRHVLLAGMFALVSYDIVDYMSRYMTR